MDTELRTAELLSQSFGDSLKDDTTECLSNILEVSLDSILQDGIVKDIPFISTAISIYRIGNSIRDRHNLKKLAVFLDQINHGIQNDDDCAKYKAKFNSKNAFRTQELEFVLVLIDRYIGYDKPAIVAKLYLTYLDGNITWDEFSVYAEIIDRFLPGDAELLCAEFPTTVKYRDTRIDGYARLVSLGLMRQVFKKPTLGLMDSFDLKISYQRTSFGAKLSAILK